MSRRSHHDGGLRHRSPIARGKSGDAIREACLLRFRPIMMTTMAATCRHAADLAIELGSRRLSLRQPWFGVVGGWQYRSCDAYISLQTSN